MQHVSLFLKISNLKWNLGFQYVESVARSDTQLKTAFSYASNFYEFFNTHTIAHTHTHTGLESAKKTHKHNRTPGIRNVNANRHFRCCKCKRKKMWCETQKCHYRRMQLESKCMYIVQFAY